MSTGSSHPSSLYGAFQWIKSLCASAVVVGLLAACGGGESIAPTASGTPTVAGPSAGSANLSKYVAIGDSFSAGYADGGVYRSAQLVSFPNLLAKQFALAGGGEFLQPLYSEAQKDGTGYLKLRTSPTDYLKTEVYGTSSLGFTGGIVGASGATPLYAKYAGANNNLSVPNLKIADVLSVGYGQTSTVGFNPHFERLLGAGNSASTYGSYVASNAAGATFFSLWLGNHDVLAYAAAGGTGSVMTSTTTFATNFQNMLNTVTAIAPQGVVLSIPQFTSYTAQFRTFTRPSLLSAIRVTAPTINDIFIQTGAGVTRPATNSDVFLLNAQAKYASFGSTTVGAGVPFPYGLHPFNPLVNADVLDADEVAAVVAHINDLNAIIQAQATAKGLIYIDVNAAGELLALASTTGISGAPFTTSTFNANFNSNGILSLDGLTLTPVGNAILANEIIKAINAKYSATLPLLNLADYVAP